MKRSHAHAPLEIEPASKRDSRHVLNVIDFDEAFLLDNDSDNEDDWLSKNFSQEVQPIVDPDENPNVTEFDAAKYDKEVDMNIQSSYQQSILNDQNIPDDDLIDDLFDDFIDDSIPTPQSQAVYYQSQSAQPNQGTFLGNTFERFQNLFCAPNIDNLQHHMQDVESYATRATVELNTNSQINRNNLHQYPSISPNMPS